MKKVIKTVKINRLLVRSLEVQVVLEMLYHIDFASCVPAAHREVSKQDYIQHVITFFNVSILHIFGLALTRGGHVRLEDGTKFIDLVLSFFHHLSWIFN